jgi:hypothetical protein
MAGETREWGRYRTQEGRILSMRRGPRNKTRFIDVATGDQIGPEQSNIFPAVCAAAAAGWWDLDAPDWLNLGMIAEVRENSRRAAK